MAKQNNILIVMLLLLVSVVQFSKDVYVPSFPTIAHEFNTSISLIQLTLFFHSLGFGFGALLYGTLSDKFGRKNILIYALIIACFGTVLCILAKSILILFLGRLIQGFGLGYTGVIRAIMRDVEDDPVKLAKIVSISGMVYALFAIVGPIMGGYVERYAFWRLDFIILIIYIVGLLYYCIFRLKETNSKLETIKIRQIFAIYYQVITNRQFIIYNIISALTFAGTMAYITKSAYLFEIKLGLTADLFGYTYFYISAMLILGSLSNVWLVNRFGRDRLIRAASIITILSGVILLFSGIFNIVNVSMILLTVGITFFSSGLIYGNTMAGAMVDFKKSAGTAGGLFACIQNFGAAIGSGMISVIKSSNQTSLGGLLLLFGLICCILTTYLKKQKYNLNII